MTCSKVVFGLRDGEVVLTRAETEHEDPVICAFLSLLEVDIRKARAGTLECCPKELARAMLSNTDEGSKSGLRRV